MGYILDFYKKPGNRKDVEKFAEDYFITDLLQKNLMGSEKSAELTALDFESSFQGDFVPSMFYIMQYMNPNMKEMDSIGKMSFHDVVPMILCTSVTKDIVEGLNFNYLPTDARAKMLDMIVTENAGYYEGSAMDGKVSLNESLVGVFADEMSRKGTFAALKDKFGVNFNLCMRRYRKDGIIRARMIELDMWKYIPFLMFKDSIHGANLAAVQKEIVEYSAQNK